MKKTNQVKEVIPEKESHKRFIKPALVIFFGAGLSAYFSHRMQVNAATERYESEMNKRIYEPCAHVDEEGTHSKITSWDKSDPELKGFPTNPDTGDLEPLKDSSGKITKDLPPGYPGIKHMHIAFLRGYIYSDGYGVSYCISCSKAKTQTEINICNDKYAYYKINQEFTIEDLDEADPELVKVPPNQQNRNVADQTTKGY